VKYRYEKCLLCDDEVGDDTATLYTEDGPQQVHRVCMLREVMGGIGHCIAHEYWCVQKDDPDGGLTRYQSARLVDAYYHVVGMPDPVVVPDE
jgi:hypothetical protein